MAADAGELRELLARLRVVVEAKDAEITMLRAELGAERELRRRLELKVAELERRLGSDSTTSGAPPSKDPIGTRERLRTEWQARQSSERERRMAGTPHVLVVRIPRAGLTWLRALGSRQATAITAVLSFFAGFLISDGYSAYQQLLPQLAGVQQCCQHYPDTVVMPIRGHRRWRAGVAGLGVSA